MSWGTAQTFSGLRLRLLPLWIAIAIVSTTQTQAASTPCDTSVRRGLDEGVATGALVEVARCFEAGLVSGYDPRLVQAPAEVPATWIRLETTVARQQTASRLNWFSPHVSGAWAVYLSADPDGDGHGYQNAQLALRGSIIDRIALRVRLLMVIAFGLAIAAAGLLTMRQYTACLAVACLACGSLLVAAVQGRGMNSVEAALLTADSANEQHLQTAPAAGFGARLGVLSGVQERLLSVREGCRAPLTTAIVRKRCAAASAIANDDVSSGIEILETSELRAEPHPLVLGALRLRPSLLDVVGIFLSLSAAAGASAVIVRRRMWASVSSAGKWVSTGVCVAWFLAMAVDRCGRQFCAFRPFPLGVADDGIASGTPMVLPGPLLVLTGAALVGIAGVVADRSRAARANPERDDADVR